MDTNSTFNSLLLNISENWRSLLIFSLIFFIYYHFTETFDYFEKRNIKFRKPVIFFGNSFRRLMGTISYPNFQLENYNYFKGERVGGIFEGRRPVLYIIDPDLIKSVLIGDSDHFIDRNSLRSREPRFLSRSLINLKGAEWKAVRSLLTPTFSSSRLKHMQHLIQHCSNQLVKYLEHYDKKEVELKDLMGHLTLEVTGTCVFGISTDALNDENAEFVKTAENFNYMSLKKRFGLLFVLFFMPSLLKYLNISLLNYEANKKLVDILINTKSKRILSNTRRNDFLQLLVDASLKEESELSHPGAKRYLDEDTVNAQALLFLQAGYETSSTLLSFAIHSLAVHQDIQEKLRAHIQDVTKGEELCYDHLTQLDYLEGVIYETLRLYPSLSRLDRECTKPYIIPGTSIKVNKGDMVSVPVYGVHMDSDIYPDAESFIPERFNSDAGKKKSHLFLSFGAGPRNCIGLRFALNVAKTTLVSLIRNYKFSTCDKTENPVTFNKRSMLLKAEKGLWVRVDKI
ncbi:cytochrome P450 9e2-like [Danaus plexippus]|uniref:unspecific monooxygenase n=1 Tax=Danaus plexippus plexippus TaxID=278856 RepID=A0A212EJD5_DANPL|nr:cytochrome P450 9e2-like [Danaus plexippus]OWR41597.1 cytochrome P450 354A5 [Danaus plexippus plexippus]